MRSLIQDHLNKITPWFLGVAQDVSEASEGCPCKGAHGGGLTVVGHSLTPACGPIKSPGGMASGLDPASKKFQAFGWPFLA